MERILLFDGVCNLCNSTVQFIIKRDPKAKFKFMPLQSEKAQQILTKNGYTTVDFDTILLSEDGKLSRKSTAALRIAKELTGLWPLLYVFIIIPPFIRNGVYSFIAANRYKWFGKKDECMVPTPELKNRFI